MSRAKDLIDKLSESRPAGIPSEVTLVRTTMAGMYDLASKIFDAPHGASDPLIHVDQDLAQLEKEIPQLQRAIKVARAKVADARRQGQK